MLCRGVCDVVLNTFGLTLRNCNVCLLRRMGKVSPIIPNNDAVVCQCKVMMGVMFSVMMATVLVLIGVRAMTGGTSHTEEDYGN